MNSTDCAVNEIISFFKKRGFPDATKHRSKFARFCVGSRWVEVGRSPNQGQLRLRVFENDDELTFAGEFPNARFLRRRGAPERWIALEFGSGHYKRMKVILTDQGRVVVRSGK